MRVWIGGDEWTIKPAEGVRTFPIETVQFDANRLIVPHHLAGEGFPTPWAPALELATRLLHHNVGSGDEAYAAKCRTAALDLLSIVIGQFLGHLEVEEHPWLAEDGANPPVASGCFGRLLHDTLAAEGRLTPCLVLLRDVTYDDDLSGNMARPIAAINHPDCLWFPPRGYRPGEVLKRRITADLGPLRLDGFDVPTERLGDDTRATLAALRTYLQRIVAKADPSLPWRRLLDVFDDGLGRLGIVPADDVRVCRGQAFFQQPPGSPLIEQSRDRSRMTRITLRWAGEPSHGRGQCPSCHEMWMNHPYRDGPCVLRGGDRPQRHVLCPGCGAILEGWTDLMSQGVFYDEVHSEYLIWGESADELTLPPGTRRLSVQPGKDGEPGKALFQINRAQVEVHGRVLTRDDVLLTQVLVLPPAAAQQPLPVRGEHASCIDWDNGGVTADPSRPARWQVALRGGWQPFSWRAEPHQNETINKIDNTTLLLWPGFDDPGWRVETVVYSLYKLSQAQPPGLRIFWRDERGDLAQTDLAGIDSPSSVARIDGKVEAIEWRDAAGKDLGYLRPHRPQVVAGLVTSATMSIDFGTCNTVIAWQPAGGTHPDVVELDQQAPPLELLASADAERRRKVAEKLDLLPFWPRFDPPRWCIPSELLLQTGSSRWTIPHQVTELPQEEADRLRDSFKWSDDEGVYSRRYLEYVLRLALANLRSRGIRSVSLRATYPLAFEPARLAGYDECLGDVIGRLADTTGMAVSLAGYASESISGLEACEEYDGDIHCIIDFGGGTTDIAVRLPTVRQQQLEPTYVDSLQIGGNNILRSLVADDQLCRAILDLGRDHDRNRPLDDRCRRLALHTVMRDLRATGQGKIPRFWTRIARDDIARSMECFGQRNQAIFDGILVAMVRLLQKAEQQLRDQQQLGDEHRVKVAVYLLGQGWNLLRLQTGRAVLDPQTSVEQRLERLRPLIPPGDKGYQASVYTPSRNVKGLPKLATCFGAIFLPPNLVEDLETITHQGRIGKRTIVGINVKLKDQAGSLLDRFELLDQDRPSRNYPVAGHDCWETIAGPMLGLASEHVRSLFGAGDQQREKTIRGNLNMLLHQQLEPHIRRGGGLPRSALSLFLERLWTRYLEEARLPGAEAGGGAGA